MQQTQRHTNKIERLPNGAGCIRSWNKRPRVPVLTGFCKVKKVKIEDVR
jgi:hypothetical protein